MTASEQRWKPNLKGLRFEPDGTTVIEVGWLDERAPDPYAHTVILSGPDKRLWRLTLESEAK